MDYTRIVAVTGLPGLYEVISSKTDGAVVRSLEDKNTRFVSSRIHNLSHLESIEVYTTRENVTLADVFNAMKTAKGTMPDVKDNKALKSYFEKVYPDLDFERVYASDLKKMVKWFEVLEQNEVDYSAKPEEGETKEEPVVETVSEEAPAKKAAKSKAAKPKSTKAEEVTKTAEAKPKSAKTAETKPKAKAEEKPKKTARKKTGE